jgi:hypothetical protein
MQRRAFIVGVAATLPLMVLGSVSFAGELRKGATMEVKPNSIWFEDTAKLTQWQKLKNGGDSTALASYQEKALSARDAWQFLSPLTVKILNFDRAKNQVHVEMKTPGRLVNSTWSLDADAVVR